MNTETFAAWRARLPEMSKHMTTPENTAAVVEWLVAVCGWDGVASAMADQAGREVAEHPEMVVKWGGCEALPAVLRLAQHLVEATT
jgi:hypothetical protein